MSTPYPGQDAGQPPYPGHGPRPPAYPGPTHEMPPAPPVYGGPPYGGSPYGGSPYGGSPYGAVPPSGGSYVPAIRPVTVTIAGWITIVLSALSLLSGVGAVAGGSALVDYLRENSRQAGLTPSEVRNLDDARLGFAVLGVALIGCALVAIAVAICVLKRQGWARITLIVLAGFTAVAGIVGAFALVVGFLWLIGAVAVIILLFVGGANEWFTRPGGSPWSGPPPGSYPPQTLYPPQGLSGPPPQAGYPQGYASHPQSYPQGYPPGPYPPR